MSNVFEINDEIIEIECIGEQDTIDISVSGNRLFYANGILTHNSGTDETDFSQSHIAGGKSKIDTADNVFGIYSSRSLKENGRYQLQLIKTRNSGGVGTKMDVGFDIDTLKLYDVGDTDTTETATSAILDKIKRSPATSQKPMENAQPKLRSLLDKVKGDT